MKKRSDRIALARLRGIGSLPDLLETAAGESAAFRTFEAARLPLEALGRPDMPIPLSMMSTLFSKGAAVLGDRTFGLRVGQKMSHLAYGQWVVYATQAPTLEMALRRLFATIWSQLSVFQMTLEPDSGYSVWRSIPPLRVDGSKQYLDHLIFPMLTLAQVFLGKDWRPGWVEVNYQRDGDAARLEAILQAPLRYGGKGVGLAFRPDDLARKNPNINLTAAQTLTLRDITADVLLGNAQEPARSLSAIVALRLLDGQYDIERAAETAGIGVQGLQRRLRVTGYTYKNVLEIARRDRAITLLTQTQLPVSEIALSLGYEEHSNFTRAFQRWMGCSPTTYRTKNGFDSLLNPFREKSGSGRFSVV